MTKDEILSYANECGLEAAANLLLLIGPDGFDGSYEDYLQLENQLGGDI